jgi:glycosyltransferase involved in cell wall biosynthesis
MFSLVIPTYNRAPILERTLAHLFSLDRISECEVIVVNDGSTDDTEAVLQRAADSAPCVFSFVTLLNGGPARARNAGVRAARFDRILFIDDDVFPQPEMLQQHARALDDGYAGSQGLLLWHPEIRVTPLIQYIDSRGSQFAFDQVKDPRQISFAHIYTGNLAVLRSAILEAGGFDESFFEKHLAFSAFEDTVFGFQLQNIGVRLALNVHAIADHLHDMNEASYLRRESGVGYNIGRLQQKYPSIARALGLQKKGRLFAASQYQFLRALNSSLLGRLIPGYAIRMRLRHREAFFHGFLQFKQVLQSSGEAA